MKKIILFAFISALAVVTANAQTKMVSILGDSYSTFKGFNPEGQAPFYPDAVVYAILNSELKEDVNESFREVCRHFGVQLIELHDIEKQNGHPSINGMKAICDQLLEAVK